MSNLNPIVNVNAEPWHRVPWQILMHMRLSGGFNLQCPPLLTNACIWEIHGCEFRLMRVRRFVDYIFKIFDIVPRADTEFKVTNIATLILWVASYEFGGAPLPTLESGIEELLS